MFHHFQDRWQFRDSLNPALDPEAVVEGASASASSQPGSPAPEAAENLRPLPEASDAPPDLSEKSRSARLLVSALLALGILLVGGGIYYDQSLDFGEPRPFAWVMLLSGMLLTGLGLAALNRPRFLDWLAARWESVQQHSGVKGGRWPLMGASLALAFIASRAAGYEPHMNNPWLAVASWAAAVGLAVWACWKPSGARFKPSWTLLLTVTALLGTALMLRGVNTQEVPHVLSGDEASSGLSAVEFINGNMDNIFTVGWFSFPSLFFFIQSLPIRLLGQTTEALRLLSALAGALTVVAVYLVGRAMFGELVGLAAGIFMTGFHFHINFSRIGLNNIWDGFWLVTVFGLFWTGWRSEKRSYFVFAGLALGLSQYFYVSARTVPLILLAWLFFAGLVDRARFKRLWLDFCLAGFIALIVFMPLGLFFASHPGEFAAPINRVTIFGVWMEETMAQSGKTFWQIMGEQFLAGLQGFTHLPLRFWYEPGTPLLRPFAATAFLLGLILLALKPKDDRFQLLFLWVAAFVLAVSLSESTPASQRFVGVAPAVALLVAYGVIETFNLFGRLWPRLAVPFGYAGLLLVVLLSADDARFYFFEYAPRSGFGGDHTLIAQDLADYLQTKSSDWKVVFFGYPDMGYFSIMSLPYLAPHIQGLDINYPLRKGRVPDFGAGRWIFVFLKNHTEDLEAVEDAYPGGDLRDVPGRYPNTHVLYWIYEKEIE